MTDVSQTEAWDPWDGDERVSVSKPALRLLYECAKSYERRIPADAHYGWAIPFMEMFEPPALSLGRGAEHTPRGQA